MRKILLPFNGLQNIVIYATERINEFYNPFSVSEID